MRIGIMQPYFLPYLGYLRLLESTDLVVFLDDVNYIKRGWINRNAIKGSGQTDVVGFNIPIIGASQNKKINELHMVDDPKWKRNMRKSIELNLGKQMHDNGLALLDSILGIDETNISAYNVRVLEEIFYYLGSPLKFCNASSLGVGGKGADRILAICKHLKASVYQNLPGGRALYNEEAFSTEGICLNFIDTDDLVHKAVMNSGNDSGYYSCVQYLATMDPQELLMIIKSV